MIVELSLWVLLGWLVVLNEVFLQFELLLLSGIDANIFVIIYAENTSRTDKHVGTAHGDTGKDNENDSAGRE